MYSVEEISSLISIIKNNFQNSLEKIILFGSYADDTATPASDIDVAIIINSIIDRKEKNKILNNLWWNASKSGLSVDFIIKYYQDYENEKVMPTLSKTINNKGKVIWQKA